MSPRNRAGSEKDAVLRAFLGTRVYSDIQGRTCTSPMVYAQHTVTASVFPYFKIKVMGNVRERNYILLGLIIKMRKRKTEHTPPSKERLPGDKCLLRN